MLSILYFTLIVFYQGTYLLNYLLKNTRITTVPNYFVSRTLQLMHGGEIHIIHTRYKLYVFDNRKVAVETPGIEMMSRNDFIPILWVTHYSDPKKCLLWWSTVRPNQVNFESNESSFEIFIVECKYNVIPMQLYPKACLSRQLYALALYIKSYM